MSSLHVPDVTGMSMLDAALAYADAGWYVVPTRPGTKNPGSVVGKGWEDKSTRDPKLVAAWFAGTDYGIALHVGRSGAVVLDIDDPVPGAELDDFLAWLADSRAPMQRTDKAGVRKHALVLMPEGRVVGNSTRGLKIGAATIDVRGQNGVVIVAPTPHVKPTGEYAWLTVGAVPPCPPQIAAQLLDTKQAPGAIGDDAAREYWKALPGGACVHMSTLAARYADALSVAGGGYRHERAKEGARALVGAGSDGHRGARDAMAALAAAFKSAVGAERDTDHEFRALTEWAIACAIEQHPTPLQIDPCGYELTPPLTSRALEIPVRTPPAMFAAALAPRTAPPLEEFIGKLILIPDAVEQAAAARKIVPELLDGVPPVELAEWRERLHDIVGMKLGAFDAILRGTKQERAEREKREREAARLLEQQERKEKGELMPGPHAPLDAARHLAQARLTAPDGALIARWWRGDFYRHAVTHWRLWAPESVDHFLYAETGSAAYTDDEGEVIDWRPGPQRVSAVAHALGRSVLYRDSDSDADGGPQAIACANGVLTPEGLQPHRPEWFNLHALPFDFNPQAECPEWLRFLESALPGDAGSQQFLQEWFGYVISGRTDLQKIASLFGPPRCGKGTIARVLTALLGAPAVTSPTLEKLATQFGEAPLIGKRLAILSDVRWNARPTAEAVPVLLAISGEDSRSIPRKNRDDWNGTLGTRFLVMGNDPPEFSDASGAMAGRMIHVRFRVSFAGREDPTLTPRLLQELPGILNWALAGLHSLTARGRFAPPLESVEADEAVRRASSPAYAFLSDRTVRVTSGEVSMRDLLGEFDRWRVAQRIESALTAARFTSRIESALEMAYQGAGLTVSAKRWDRTRTYQSRFISGLAIAPPEATELTPPRFGASEMRFGASAGADVVTVPNRP